MNKKALRIVDAGPKYATDMLAATIAAKYTSTKNLAATELYTPSRNLTEDGQRTEKGTDPFSGHAASNKPNSPRTVRLLSHSLAGSTAPPQQLNWQHQPAKANSPDASR